LLHVRAISFLFMVPFFGRELLPNTFKVFFATALSFMLFLYTDQKPIEFATKGRFFLAVLKEFLFGFFSGLFLRLIFDTVAMEGEIIGINMGLSIATLFLPQQSQASVFSVFFMLLFTSFFLSGKSRNCLFLPCQRSI